MKRAVVLALVLVAAGPPVLAAPPGGGGADLAVTMQDRPDPVDVGADLTYEIVVQNVGRRTAAAATLSDPLPGSVTLRAATTTKGSCSGSATVTCSIGDLGKGASATVTIRATPNAAGTVTNSASASSPSDTAGGNNTASTQTTVREVTSPPPDSPPLLPDSNPVWVERCDPCGPAARAEAPMVYDATTGNVLLFGGRDTQGPVQDIWTWNGVAWVRQVVTPSPAWAGWNAAAAYDPTLRGIVVFDRAGDTWLWDGPSVRFLRLTPPTSPSRRGYAAMAYHPPSGKLVLYGGANTFDGTLLGDTWTFDPRTTSWTLVSAAGPPSRAGASMATDPATGNVVLFGGCGDTPTLTGCAPMDETWTWDGDAWTQRLTAQSPSPRFGAGLANDDARNQVLLMGGMDDCCVWRDVWAWDGVSGAWTPLNGSTTQAPSFRGSNSLANDKRHHQVVLFGGVGSNGVLDDTWTYGAPL